MENRWARGSNQYKKRFKPATSSAEPPPLAVTDDRSALTGITWDSDAVDFALIEPTSVERARTRFRAQLPSFIWDAAALEGNPYTLPEVQTLLEGITVSGHRTEDQDQILALNEGYNLVDHLVGDGRFALDKLTSDRVHGLIARHEAIESGAFRGEGSVHGGGLVGLGEHGTFQASEPGDGGENLLREHRNLLDYLEVLPDPRERAIAYFAAATRRQLYFDGNKRTARAMMAGELMAHGFDAISVSANRRLEFNQALTDLFVSGDATDLIRFVIDCRPRA